MEDKSESTPPLPSYLRLPLYFSLCTKRIKETKKKAAAALAFCRIHRFLQPTPGMSDFDSDSDSDFFGPYGDFDDLLTVHPTELRIPLELDKEHYSCSIQLTNKTERIVAYFFRPFRSSTILLESPDPERDVGTILPRSTSSVTLTVNLSEKEPPPEDKWIDIWASVVKDGVKAEDITCYEDLFRLIGEVFGFFRMPVVYYYSTVVPAANPSSAVPIEEIALTLATPGMSDSKFGPDSHFDDLLTVHPTALNNLVACDAATTKSSMMACSSLPRADEEELHHMYSN